MRTPAEAGGLVGPHLQAFFAEHLLAHKRASPQTIACYRDPFRLLLRFMRERTGAEPAALPLAALDADAVLAFLDYIERDRNCTVRSRNNRLAAIRSFFRLVALHVPDSLGQVTRVMAIATQRGDKRRVNYLTRDEVKALLAAPDRTGLGGPARPRAAAEYVQQRRAFPRSPPYGASSRRTGRTTTRSEHGQRTSRQQSGQSDSR